MDEEYDPLITKYAIALRNYIQKTWPRFNVELERPMRELFPDPGKGGLKSMWSHGQADVVVYHKGKIIAIFEPGGNHHFVDDQQRRRDRCKWKICQMNGVRCHRFANSLLTQLSNRKLRQMIGKFLFGC